MSAPITQGAPGWYHPGRSGTIAMGPKVIAQFGELHPKVLAAFDLRAPAAGFEIFLDAILDTKSKGKSTLLFAPSPYQAVERDFAFVVDAKLAAGEIVKAVKLADRNLIEQVTVFDVYEGKGVPDGKKSVAIAVRIQPKDATLTDAEIDALAQKIVAAAARARRGLYADPPNASSSSAPASVPSVCGSGSAPECPRRRTAPAPGRPNHHGTARL